MRNSIFLSLLVLAIILSALTQSLLKPPKPLKAYYASEIVEFVVLNREYVGTLIPDSRNEAFTFNEKLDGFVTNMLYNCSQRIGGSYPKLKDGTTYLKHIHSTSYEEQVSMLAEWQYEYRTELLIFYEEFKILTLTYATLLNDATINKTTQFKNTKRKIELLTTFFNNQHFNL